MALRETIIVKPVKNEGRKENGIYIPPVFEESLYRYEVIKGGTKPLSEDLKKGDIVYTRDTNGHDFEFEGEEVKIIDRSEIIAIDG